MVVLALGGGITGYFAVELAVACVNLVWTQRLAARLRAELPEPAPIEPERRRELRSFMQASTFFAVIEFVVLSRSEVVFLSHYSGPVQVGYYSVAFAAAAAAARVPAMITSVAMPAVATLHGAGEHDRIRGGFWRATRLLVALCPTLVVAAAVLGTDLLGIVYGAEFHDAEPVLVILLAPSILLPIAGMADAVLWILGRIRFLVIWGTIAAVVNIGLAFVLIPLLDAIGAGIVNVVAQLVAGVPALWLAARILAPAGVPSWLVRNSLLTAVGSGVAALIPMLVLGGVAGLVCGAALLAADAVVRGDPAAAARRRGRGVADRRGGWPGRGRRGAAPHDARGVLEGLGAPRCCAACCARVRGVLGAPAAQQRAAARRARRDRDVVAGEDRRRTLFDRATAPARRSRPSSAARAALAVAAGCHGRRRPRRGRAAPRPSSGHSGARSTRRRRSAPTAVICVTAPPATSSRSSSGWR